MTLDRPEPQAIPDARDPRLDPYRELKGADAVLRRRGVVLEGATVLARVAAQQRIPLASVLLSERRLERMAPVLQALAPEVAVYVAPQDVMDAACGFPVHRGVLAFGPAPEPLDAAGLLAGLPARALALAVVGVSDVENMGALFRNAAAFGVDAVLLDARSCDPLYRRAVRVSMGGALITPFARLDGGADLLATLRQQGFQPLALSPTGAVELRDLRPGVRTALLVGAEGPGLPTAILQEAVSVRITMAAGFDSLNVATAAAVALHHLAGPAR